MHVDLDELSGLLRCPRCFYFGMKLAPPPVLMAGMLIAWCGRCDGPLPPEDPRKVFMGTPVDLFERCNRLPRSAFPPIVHLSFDDTLDTFKADLERLVAKGAFRPTPTREEIEATPRKPALRHDGTRPALMNDGSPMFEPNVTYRWTYVDEPANPGIYERAANPRRWAPPEGGCFRLVEDQDRSVLLLRHCSAEGVDTALCEFSYEELATAPDIRRLIHVRAANHGWELPPNLPWPHLPRREARPLEPDDLPF